MENPDPEGNYLLLDAAGPMVQTGLWRAGRWIVWRGEREAAGRSLFSGVEEIFRQTGLALPDLAGFFFCEGPGSMLGIRMAAMAIRGWQSLLDTPLPLFTYNSHVALAKDLLQKGSAPPFQVISDARRQRWNVLRVTEGGTVGKLERRPAEDLAQFRGRHYRMEEINRSTAPVEVDVIPYTLQDSPELFLQGILRREPVPEALLQEAPAYKKWSAERHR